MPFADPWMSLYLGRTDDRWMSLMELLAQRRRRGRWKGFRSVFRHGNGLYYFSKFLRMGPKQKGEAMKGVEGYHRQLVDKQAEVEAELLALDWEISALEEEQQSTNRRRIKINKKTRDEKRASWNELEGTITKIAARMAAYIALNDPNEFVGQCACMNNFNDIRKFFCLESYDDIERRIVTQSVGYIVAQALDTAGVPYHEDFKGEFQSLNYWYKMGKEQLHKEIAKALQIGVKRSYSELVDWSDIEEDFMDDGADLCYSDEIFIERARASGNRRTSGQASQDDVLGGGRQVL